MTKAELIEALVDYPDTYEVRVSAVVYCPHAENEDCYYQGLNLGHGEIRSCNPPKPSGSVINGIKSDDRGVSILLETVVG